MRRRDLLKLSPTAVIAIASVSYLTLVAPPPAAGGGSNGRAVAAAKADTTTAVQPGGSVAGHGWDPSFAACDALTTSEVAKALAVPQVTWDNTGGVGAGGSFGLSSSMTPFEQTNLSTCLWTGPANLVLHNGLLVLIPELSAATLSRILLIINEPSAEKPGACKPVGGIGASACTVSYTFTGISEGEVSRTELYAVKGRLELYFALGVAAGKVKTDTPARLLAQEEQLARLVFARTAAAVNPPAPSRGWEPAWAACDALTSTEVARALIAPQVTRTNRDYLLGSLHGTTRFEATNTSACTWTGPGEPFFPFAVLVLIPEPTPATLNRLVMVVSLYPADLPGGCKPVAGAGTHACAVLSSLDYDIGPDVPYSSAELYAVKGRLGLYFALCVAPGKTETHAPARLLAQEEQLAGIIFARVPFVHK